LSSSAKLLEEQVATWPHVSVAPHRFGGREFRFNKAEIGHVHFWGVVDIPYPRAIHDALLADQLTQPHRWLPDSGWVIFHMSSAADLDHALRLMRLSWLLYTLKSAPDPSLSLREESEQLHLGPTLASLLAQFVPAHTDAREPLTC
jgi:hypothetical protein